VAFRVGLAVANRGERPGWKVEPKF
jgi:hypothetical protein